MAEEAGTQAAVARVGEVVQAAGMRVEGAQAAGRVPEAPPVCVTRTSST